MRVHNPSQQRSRDGRLLGGAAVALIVTGGTVLGFGACARSGPPRPAAGSAQHAVPGPANTSGGPQLGASSPVRLDIPRIGVHTSLIAVGLGPDGTIEVPPLDRSGIAGWYKLGPTPGQRGAAVILGHVDNKQGPAVFFKLGLLRRHDAIDVSRADGTVAVFRVDATELVPKSEFPTSRVYGNLNYPGLRLVTCGGAFDSTRHSYVDNTIVYAHLTSWHRQKKHRPTSPREAGKAR